MNLIESINSGKIISIAYDKDSKEYLFSELDKIVDISYVNYKDQLFEKDDLISNSEAFLRDNKISLILSDRDMAYFVVNLDNFNSNESALNKDNEIKNLINFISSLSYMWSNESIKIKSIFITESFIENNELRINNIEGIKYSSDLVLSLKNKKIKIVKDLNVPCSIDKIRNYPIPELD